VAVDSQCCLSALSPRKGAWKHQPSGCAYRLTAVFRLKRGLQSQNPLIVAVSGHILAAMNDTGSIPLILQRINTSRATVSEMLTDRIALFNGDQAERAIQTALVNPKLKERYRGLIEAKHKQPSSATH
jgi:hypothetical protein